MFSDPTKFNLPIDKLASLVTNQKNCTDSYLNPGWDVHDRYMFLLKGREQINNMLRTNPKKMRHHLSLRRQNVNYIIPGYGKEFSDNYFHLCDSIKRMKKYIHELSRKLSS